MDFNKALVLLWVLQGVLIGIIITRVAYDFMEKSVETHSHIEKMKCSDQASHPGV